MTDGLRTCSRCRTPKPPDEFPRDASQSGGFSSHCRECDRRRKKKRRGTLGKHEEREVLAAEGKKRCAGCSEVKERGEFRPKKGARDGLQSWCRPCQNGASKEAERRKAPEKKAARAEAAKLRPARPPRKTDAERARMWKAANPDRAREVGRRYRATTRGRLMNRLQSAKRRANMNGTVTPEQWERVKAAWNHKCAYCGTLEAKLTLDHVVPVMRGGLHDAGNVVPACLPCNDVKNDAPLDVALARLGVDAFRWKSRRWFALRAAAALAGA